MNKERVAGLKEYCIGLVLEKERTSSEIKVWPSAELSLYKGKLSDAKHTETISMPDSQGNTKSSTVKYGSVIRANWVLGESNRITAPDVVPGESVVIYRYADTDEYYWRPLYSSEAALRRKEHVVYGYSNVPDGIGEKEFDESSSYWMMVSTFLQLIQLHTSNNDGEKVEYDIRLNAKDGLFTWEDGLGNKMTIDSTGALIRHENKEGVLYEINGDNINESFNNVKHLTGKRLIIDVEEIVSSDGGSGSVGINCQSFTITSDTTRISSTLIDNPQINDHEVRITRLEGFH